MAKPVPYRVTPIFDADTLPAALRSRHETKEGVWGVIRVLSGALDLHIVDPPATQRLTPNRPGVVAPRQPHYVLPIGAMAMRVEFYREPPAAEPPKGEPI